MEHETDSNEAVLGVIGGSGVYALDCIEDVQSKEVDTPYGAPSSALQIGQIDGRRVVFLPRHGIGHPHTPSSVPYRANIFALKAEGVTDILSLSAVGSLAADLPPGHFVVVDQFIDRSFARPKTFFEEGLVAHVSVADPVCSRLGNLLAESAKSLGYAHTKGGTYLCMEGPQFSTRAESELYRGWGCSVIGMTNMPEAKLAREAEICYATLAMVTDFDCWHTEHDAVEVSALIKVLRDNASRAKSLAEEVVKSFGKRRSACAAGCDRVLDSAIITAPEARDPAMTKRLAPLLSRLSP